MVPFVAPRAARQDPMNVTAFVAVGLAGLIVVFCAAAMLVAPFHG